LKKRVLPPEWAEQEYIQLTWPHAGSDWAPYLSKAVACFKEIATAILKYENLIIVCSNAAEVKAVLKDLDLSRITFFETNTNDTWARDHGGITVIEDGKGIIYDFMFNGWGLKFASNYDNLITGKLHKKLLSNKYGYRNQLNFVLEGGAIESDGEGTLLTTTECLLSLNRNGGSTKDEIEQYLKQTFGLDRVLWLNSGYLAGDDTDSHVDTLARLCSVNTIAYVQCKNINDEHFQALRKMEEELKSFKTKTGEPYQLIPLPMTEYVEFEGQRLPATYANFLIMNGAVLVPTYNTSTDKTALDALKVAFPDREIIGIDCSVLVKQHGSLHCVTMQYPKI